MSQLKPTDWSEGAVISVENVECDGSTVFIEYSRTGESFVPPLFFEVCVHDVCQLVGMAKHREVTGVNRGDLVDLQICNHRIL